MSTTTITLRHCQQKQSTNAGVDSVINGTNAGRRLLSSDPSVALYGNESLSSATSASQFIGIGYKVGQNATKVWNDVYIGNNTGYNNNGSNNVLIGNNTGNRTGSFNTYLGNNVASVNQGSNNTYVGYLNSATASNTSLNTSVGYAASAAGNASVSIGACNVNTGQGSVTLGTNISNTGNNSLILLSTSNLPSTYVNHLDNFTNINNVLFSCNVQGASYTSFPSTNLYFGNGCNAQATFDGTVHIRDLVVDNVTVLNSLMSHGSNSVVTGCKGCGGPLPFGRCCRDAWVGMSNEQLLDELIGSLFVHSNLYVGGELVTACNQLLSDWVCGSNFTIPIDVVVQGHATMCNGMDVLGPATFSNGQVHIADLVVDKIRFSNGGSLCWPSTHQQWAAMSNELMIDEMLGSLFVHSNLYVGGHLITASNCGGGCGGDALVDLQLPGDLVVQGKTQLGEAHIGNLIVDNITILGGLNGGSSGLTNGGRRCRNAWNGLSNEHMLDEILGSLFVHSNLYVGGELTTACNQLLTDWTCGSNFIVPMDTVLRGHVTMCNGQDVFGASWLSNLTVGGTSTMMCDLSDVDCLVAAKDIAARINGDICVSASLYSKAIVTDQAHCRTQHIESNVSWGGCSNPFWNQRMLVHTTGQSADMVFNSRHGTCITFTDEFTPEVLNFTGKHRCVYKGLPTREDIGKVVVSVGQYCNLDDEHVLSIDEAIPVVSLSSEARQSTVFGVISAIDNIGTFALGNIRFKKTLNSPRVTVNGAGEGAIWVCNINGALKNGDLLCTSSMPGYAMRQADDVVHSYTVAKSTCNCDFKNEDGLTVREVYNDGVVVHCVLIGCIYKV